MPYKKGQSGNPSGKKKVPDLPPGDDDELVVMRHVRRNPKDETYQQWQSRQERERDREGWEEFYRRLEVNDRKGRSTTASPSGPPDGSIGQPTTSPAASQADEGTGRSMELLSEEWARLEPLLEALRPASGT